MHELEQAGAVIQDRHFVYKSHKHGSGYINMDSLFPNPELMWQVGVELWTPFIEQGFDVVAAPATGGIVLDYAVAFSLRYEVDVGSGGPAVTVVWADKDGDDFVFERATFADCLNGKRVLLVEDLLTTGDSVNKVVRQVEQSGGEIIGVSAVCNRGGVTAGDLGVPRLEALANVSFEAVKADECPLCAEQRPIVEDIGHGAEFKATNPGYPGGYIKLLG